MTTGERIKFARENLGMTMEQLARKVGVQASAINKYEKGITDIPLSRLKKIATALWLDVEDLVDWFDEPSDSVDEKLIRQFADKMSGIDEDERLLLTTFRVLSDDEKKDLMLYAMKLHFKSK